MYEEGLCSGRRSEHSSRRGADKTSALLWITGVQFTARHKRAHLFVLEEMERARSGAAGFGAAKCGISREGVGMACFADVAVIESQ